MIKITAVLSAMLLVVFGLSPSASASSKLTSTTHPILLPDRANSTDCNFSVAEVSFNPKKAFTTRDSIDIMFSVEEGPVSTNLAPQNSGETGLSRIFYAPGSNRGPDSHLVNVQLCTDDLSAIDPEYLWLYLTLRSPEGQPKDAVKVKMQVLKPTPQLIAENNFIETCSLGDPNATLGNNVIFDVKQARFIYDWYTYGTIGMELFLEGTLVRQGIVSPNEYVYFVSSSGTKLLAQAKTDDKGQFRVRFNAPRSGGAVGSWSDSIGIAVTEKAMKFGALTRLMKSSQDYLSIDWLLNPRITRAGDSNWIPQLPQSCIDAHSASLLENEDDRNRVRSVLISAALRYLGTSNKSSSDKKTFVNSNGAWITDKPIYKSSVGAKKVYKKAFSGGGSGSGGRCYVNGYYRSGGYVKGYFRSC